MRLRRMFMLLPMLPFLMAGLSYGQALPCEDVEGLDSKLQCFAQAIGDLQVENERLRSQLDSYRQQFSTTESTLRQQIAAGDQALNNTFSEQLAQTVKLRTNYIFYSGGATGAYLRCTSLSCVWSPQEPAQPWVIIPK